MNILLINHYAGSPKYGMEYRPYYLSREFIRKGHEVTIVAASWSHVRTTQPELTSRRIRNEVIDGIQYIWLPTPAYSGNGITRVLNMFVFVWQLFLKARKFAIQYHPDLVIASSTYPLDIYPARRIARLARAKLVFEVHDLWPLSPIELGGISRWHPFIMLLQRAEDYAYQKSDVVISMLPNVHEYMKTRGLKLDKLHIVPNGIDPDEWQADLVPVSEPVSKLLADLKDEGWKLVGYTGSHGVANALGTLLDVAHLLKKEKVAIILVGSGPEKAGLMKRVKDEMLDNVWFQDPVKKEQIPALLSMFDIVYIGLQRQPLFRFGIAPNKLMDYMMAARPVIMAIDSGNDPVSEAECGLTVPPEDPDALAEGIRKLIDIPESTRTLMGKNGRTYVIKNHAYPVLAERFLTACGDTVR